MESVLLDRKVPTHSAGRAQALKINTDKSRNLLGEHQKIIETRCLANYRDYVAENCKRCRDGDMENKIEGLQICTGSK